MFVAVLVVVPLDRLQRSGGVHAVQPEVCLSVLELLLRDLEPTRSLQCAHLHRQRLCVILHKVVQVPLEV